MLTDFHDNREVVINACKAIAELRVSHEANIKVLVDAGCFQKVCQGNPPSPSLKSKSFVCFCYFHHTCLLVSTRRIIRITKICF